MRTRLPRLALVGLVVLALGACESPLSPTELRALGDAEAHWMNRGFQDYAFEMQQSCFCPPEVNQWGHIEVVAGSVTRVVLLETGAEMSPIQRTYFRTVEQVFNAIRTANQDASVKDVVAEFDPQLGFPTYVRFVPKPDILDAGATYYLRNAGPLLLTPTGSR